MPEEWRVPDFTQSTDGMRSSSRTMTRRPRRAHWPDRVPEEPQAYKLGAFAGDAAKSARDRGGSRPRLAACPQIDSFAGDSTMGADERVESKMSSSRSRNTVLPSSKMPM